MKSFKDISEKLKKDKDDPCWKGYVQVGTKNKDGKEVPNCVPKEGVDEKKDTHKTKDGRTAKKGLWYNINQKKKRGEAPAKKGDPDYPKTLNIESIEEKAVSKAQQKFMGMVRAKQKGEMPDASPEVAKAAASMSKKDVKDFAKTKHKGLPAKKESVQEASGKDIAAKMMKSKSMKAFAAKVARMPNVSAGDLEKMLPDYVSGAEIRKLFEEADLAEANRNHPAAKKLMALAKQRDAGSDAKDYEKAAQMIMKGDAGQLGRYISRMDSYPRDAVISAVKSTDKAMYDKMMGRMESAEPMNFFEFRQALTEGFMDDYKAMKAKGKSDAAAIEVMLGMPKYRKMSRDQLAKKIGDEKRKGIFKR